MFGDLRVGHSGKETENDNLSRASVDRLEACRRGLESQEIFDRHFARLKAWRQASAALYSATSLAHARSASGLL